MEQKIREYAKLLIEVGLNVQKGQTLVISSPVDCAYFARLCASAAYDVGCREVVMRWTDDYLNRERFLRADDSVFDSLPLGQKEFLNGYAAEGAAYLNISACDPEALRGVDPDRITRANRCKEELSGFYDAMMANVNPWCIASIPIPSWSKKVFPGVPEDEAMKKLWDAIFTSVRISGKGDAVARWREHIALLKARVAKLNELHFASLYYQNSLGTSLNIKLPETHVWSGGDSLCRTGRPFVANMPTEEIFTAPLRTGINGVVYAALPLVHNGNIIENFHFVIRDGRIVEAHAEKGEEILKAAIAEDEGASYFGEVALVPYDSPISNQKLLFYNTLFDENAACHLAFGEAYPECVEGGEAMSKEELKAAGLNDSITHVDFMIGTSDLSIIGTTGDGREVPVFADGNFAL
ncbi:MAG: aminopeptidase [Oscillospiraceae bacterium]|nr:aminopeptidase [Oscillospiraceae bacterium]